MKWILIAEKLTTRLTLRFDTMTIQPTKNNLQEIRQAIDEVDEVIVNKLAERWALSMSAVTYKVNEKAFKDNNRRDALIKKCAELGEKQGIPSEVMIVLYNKLIDLVEGEQENILKSLHI